MKTSLFLAGAASALLFGSAAMAQSSPSAPAESQAPAATAPSSGAAAQSSFTDEQLKSFADVTLEMQRSGATQDQAAMAAAVQKSGLTVDQYNQIATQMRADPAFNTRVQQMARASTGAPAESSTTNPSSGAPAARSTTPPASGGSSGASPQGSTTP